MGTSKLLGDNLTKCWEVTCDGLVSHPWGVEILLVASYSAPETEDKCRPHGPLTPCLLCVQFRWKFALTVFRELTPLYCLFFPRTKNSLKKRKPNVPSSWPHTLAVETIMKIRKWKLFLIKCCCKSSFRLIIHYRQSIAEKASTTTNVSCLAANVQPFGDTKGWRPGCVGV